jgi:uncharacterized protein (DUF58 family)
MSRLLPFFIILLAVALFTKIDFFFYLLYTLFGVYLLGRLWARQSLQAVALQRRLDDRVFLEETFTVEVELRNLSWLPVLWLRVHDTIPGDLGSAKPFRRVVSLLPRERLALNYALTGRRRGYYRIGPLVTLGGDLLGSATYENRQTEDDFVVVYPKILALRDLGLPSQSPFGTIPSRERIFEDPTRIQGVRDYQPGDSLRRMDWKTSARVGSLQVRRYEPAISLETMIFLNLNGQDYRQRYRHHATELGIVVAASAAVHLAEKRQAVGLATNGRDPLQPETPESETRSLPPAHPPRKGREHLMHMLDLLARIEISSGDETVPFLSLLSRKSLGLPWGSTVVVVTAQEVEGLLDTLLALRRRGLFVLLATTCPDRSFALTAQRAGQIGIQAIRVWSEQDVDVWR